MAAKMPGSSSNKKRGRGRPPKGPAALSETQHVRLTPELSALTERHRLELERQMGRADGADAIRALMQAGALALGYLQSA